MKICASYCILKLLYLFNKFKSIWQLMVLTVYFIYVLLYVYILLISTGAKNIDPRNLKRYYFK